MMNFATSFKTVLAAGVVGVSAIASAPAVNAATISAVFAQNGNGTTEINMGSTPSDCSGYFGTGFSLCDVGTPLGVTESGSIAKWDVEESSWEVNDDYNTSLSDAFSLNGAGANDATGSFTYSGVSSDPTVRFWVAKQATAFRLYWTVDDALVTAGTCAGGDDIGNYTADCIAAALGVTSGSWASPFDTGLSHVTFYNGDGGGGTGGCTDCPEPPVVPLPAAGWMLIAGLGGLAAMKRRKLNKAA